MIHYITNPAVAQAAAAILPGAAAPAPQTLNRGILREAIYGASPSFCRSQTSRTVIKHLSDDQAGWNGASARRRRWSRDQRGTEQYATF